MVTDPSFTPRQWHKPQTRIINPSAPSTRASTTRQPVTWHRTQQTQRETQQSAASNVPPWSHPLIENHSKSATQMHRTKVPLLHEHRPWTYQITMALQWLHLLKETRRPVVSTYRETVKRVGSLPNKSLCMTQQR